MGVGSGGVGGRTGGGATAAAPLGNATAKVATLSVVTGAHAIMVATHSQDATRRLAGRKNML
jgi:hypothetical protein